MNGNGVINTFIKLSRFSFQTMLLLHMLSTIFSNFLKMSLRNGSRKKFRPPCQQ